MMPARKSRAFLYSFEMEETVSPTVEYSSGLRRSTNPPRKYDGFHLFLEQTITARRRRSWGAFAGECH